jgi:hypothetical protein
MIPPPDCQIPAWLVIAPDSSDHKLTEPPGRLTLAT